MTVDSTQHSALSTQHSSRADVDAHGSAVGDTRPIPFATRPVLQGTLGMVAAGHYLAATVAAQFASWCSALQHFGTATLADVLGPTVEMAEAGFPMYAAMRNAIAKGAARYTSEWPTSADVYLPGGQLPDLGELVRN